MSDTDLAFDQRCLQSLAHSRRRRRVADTLRRRRVRRRGGGLSLATVALMVAVAGAGAAAGHQTVTGSSGGGTLLSESRGSMGAEVSAVQRALGVPASGVFGPATTRAVRSFQAKRGLLVDGIVGPQTRAALGLGGSASAGAAAGTGGSGPSAGGGSSGAAGGAVPGVLQQIAQCESGGNPSAIGGGGRYRGKYQFDRATWAALGGTGDPAAAPEAEQDRLAARLYAQSGTAPWANCA